MKQVGRRIARALGSAALWALAVVGVAGGVLWVAHALGLVQPLIVVSGSMSPEIRAGDLLFATPTPAAEVEVGEVATLSSSLADKLVTHRVISATELDGQITFEMKGDANDGPDPETYTVAADAPVWQPVVTLPGVGRLVMSFMQPTVLLPFVGGVLCVIALSIVPVRPATTEGENIVSATPSTRDGAREPEPMRAPSGSNAGAGSS